MTTLPIDHRLILLWSSLKSLRRHPRYVDDSYEGISIGFALGEMEVDSGAAILV